MTLTNRFRPIFVLLLSLLGTAALFLPFTSVYSPWKVLTDWDGLSLLAAPFFLSIPIFAWQSRRLIADHLTTRQILLAYLISTVAMLSTAVWLGMFTFFLVREPPESGYEFYKFTVLVVACWLVLIANVLLLMRNRRARLSREAIAEAFILGSYLPNAIFCLAAFYPQGFFSGWKIGAYMIAVVSVGYLISIVLALRAEQRFSAAIPTT